MKNSWISVSLSPYSSAPPSGSALTLGAPAQVAETAKKALDEVVLKPGLHPLRVTVKGDKEPPPSRELVEVRAAISEQHAHSAMHLLGSFIEIM